MKIKILPIFILILLLVNFKKNEFVYKSVPPSLIKVTPFKLDLLDFKDITNYLPKNAKKDGSEDYTVFIQNALNRENKIIMPNFPILINEKGLNINNNTSIFFQSKSQLIIKPNDKTNYGIINIINKININLYNARIIGDRYTHLNDKGEWGMGINLIDSKNIKIINPKISECWGDGIYIGTKENISENVIISGGYVDNNRRNGISIISGKNITIENIVLANTNGTFPMAGIDLEPNNRNEYLSNIELLNITSYNNAEDGFLIYLFKLISEKSPEVSINITNCKDYYSSNSISIPGLRNDYDKSYKPITGKIIFKDFKSYDAESPFKESSGNYVFTPKIFFNSFQVFKDEKQNSRSEEKVVKWLKSKKMNVD